MRERSGPLCAEETTGDGRSDGSDGRGRWRVLISGDELRDVVLVTIVLRAGLMALAAAALAVVGEGGLQGRDALSMWNAWDAPHYIGISQYGYGAEHDPAEIAFFPLVPLLIRVGSLVLPPLVAGMLISLLATVAAGIGLYRLVLLDGDRRVALGAVLALNLFPTSFALIPPYSEPVFLCLVVWSFYLARRGGWGGSAALGALASAARLQGLFLAPSLAVEYFAQRRRLGAGVLWLLLVPAGTVAYLAVNQVAFGDPLYFLVVQREHFFHAVAAPWEVIGGLVDGIVGQPPTIDWATLYVAPLLAFGVLLATAIWTLASPHSRPSYAAYAWLTLLTLVTLTWPISVPRYLLGVFPLFIALGRLAHRPVLGGLLLAVSAMLLVLLTLLFAQGAWAF